MQIVNNLFNPQPSLIFCVHFIFNVLLTCKKSVILIAWFTTFKFSPHFGNFVDGKIMISIKIAFFNVDGYNYIQMDSMF